MTQNDKDLIDSAYKMKMENYKAVYDMADRADSEDTKWLLRRIANHLMELYTGIEL